jgi:DUF4097 and DUF4098 domain-containing protein YvlB
MRLTLSLTAVAVAAAACAFPNFKSTKVVELKLPATKLERLKCESHNGNIKLTGDAAAAEISLHAELTVRGHTQEEADANLHLLEVGQEQDGGTLRIFGKYPKGELNNRSPSFRFTLVVPTALAVELSSHNGNIAATGIAGTAKFETHNGNIDGSLRTNQVIADTHNGNVDLRLEGEGSLDGSVTSHNGNIDLVVASGLGTQLQASTHNGRVTPPANVVDAAASKRRFTCRLGDGKGKLVVGTHNGNVKIR